jgi:hypothetical protein
MALDPLFLTPLVPKFDPAETVVGFPSRISELVERGVLRVHAPGELFCHVRKRFGSRLVRGVVAMVTGTAPVVAPDQIILVLGDFRGDVWIRDV